MLSVRVYQIETGPLISCKRCGATLRAVLSHRGRDGRSGKEKPMVQTFERVIIRARAGSLEERLPLMPPRVRFASYVARFWRRLCRTRFSPRGSRWMAAFPKDPES